ncbi:MAG: type II toxin-antitoxin system VapC family toxin [Myxococcales bacterium]|nr:type II toxin-antitoxin system VapC family toxin [Myxococcales bacterium]
MIIDTSAVVAILRQEPEGARFSELLLRSEDNRVSAGTLLELQIVAIGYRISAELGEFLDLIGAEVVPFDEIQAELAREGFEKFGKGRHPAGLNFGDCFSYALAKALDEPLLFKGDDFSKTDVALAS